MDIRELMVGDVVGFDNGVAEVVLINLLDNTVWVRRDGNVFNTDAQSVKPIPITVDFVEANGFRKVGDTQFYNEYETEDRRMRFLDLAPLWGEGVWYLHVDDSDMDTVSRVTLRSVHEVQHAYRQCRVGDPVLPKTESEEDRELAEFERFREECKKGLHRVVKWSEIPKLVKVGLQESCTRKLSECETADSGMFGAVLSEAISEYKSNYNIDTIVL